MQTYVKGKGLDAPEWFTANSTINDECFSNTFLSFTCHLPESVCCVQTLTCVFIYLILILPGELIIYSNNLGNIVTGGTLWMSPPQREQGNTTGHTVYLYYQVVFSRSQNDRGHFGTEGVFWEILHKKTHVVLMPTEHQPGACGGRSSELRQPNASHLTCCCTTHFKTPS